MKKIISRRFFGSVISALPLLVAVPKVWAQSAGISHGTQPIRLIVPFPTGGGSDLAARLFAKKLAQLGPQPVIVENRPGGNGLIAVNTVLSAPPDGNTIFIGSSSTLTTNIVLLKDLPYDPVEDFAPISMLARGPCVLIVPSDSPFKKVKDLVDDAKMRPGMLNYGSPSASYKLMTEWFNQENKISTVEIPFKGAAEVVTAVASKQLDFAVIDRSAALALIQAGRVRALMQTTEKRSAVLPNVPSASEAGLPDYLPANWVAATVHAKVPEAIRAKLVAMFLEAGKDSEIRSMYESQNTELVMSTPEALALYQREEIERLKRIASAANIKPQ